jgi:imidazolonepropionase-like amidohydrolase
VLLGAPDAADVAERLAARKDQVGIVVSPEMERTRDRKRYQPAVDLSRQGLHVALQSDSEDGARALPLMGLFAVEEGMGGDAALKALTIDAARMYKLDDRIGSLAAGKDGDVLLFSGYPFDADSRLERVIVGGREVPDEQ